ncbi:hypothetical protein PHABIO_95 [Pseudomonas phage Phabio]|uniref:Uncharacterized protein n=1 Tax=Pseudomonas phage Phabio TaxID=2006668 RepID=A0A1Y0SYJ4_9CAUD|nr:hypothetical protein MZD05_gp095 [Pseudomonas phage Phabio]ARV76726.1 hypothetical protein PHABIO_95 [Pseudomonas phage Phabio]
MKLPKKALRRNTVVIHKDGTFYGRVIRVLPDGNIFWLNSGKHFIISKPEDLQTGYKGCKMYRGVREQVLAFIHMTTLRHLKKKAQRFHYEYAHNTPLDYHFIQRM